MKRIVWPVVAVAIAAAVMSTAQATLSRERQDPSRTARTLLAQWRAYVQKGAKLNPKPSFAKARRATIVQIVKHNARRYSYVPQRVKVLPGRDGAPMVVVKVPGRLLAFSKAFPALWRVVGYKYEAFFFEAVDSHQIPFLVVWNAWRKPPRGGGQWARTQALLPFPHG